jgi:hypothetical protein
MPPAKRYRISFEVNHETYDFFQKIPWGVRSKLAEKLLSQVIPLLQTDMRTAIQLILSGRIELACRTDSQLDPIPTLARGRSAGQDSPSQPSDKQEASSRGGKASPSRADWQDAASEDDPFEVKKFRPRQP